MLYKLPKILNKSDIAKTIGMSVSLFHKKLNLVNYNKFSDKEIISINKVLKEEILQLEAPLRSILVDFCKDLGLPAIELLKMDCVEYVVDNYLNKIEQ